MEEDILKKLDNCLSRIELLSDEVEHFRSIIGSLCHLEERAEESLGLFIKKAHALKQIDAKRDDVLDLMNQKIAKLEARINELERDNE